MKSKIIKETTGINVTKAKMTDEQIEIWIADKRSRFAEGTLPAWQVASLEAMTGWSWTA